MSCAPGAGHRDLEPAGYFSWDGAGLHGQLIHIDQVLAQPGEVDLGPVGLRIGFEDLHDFLDRPEGLLAGHRRHPICRADAGQSGDRRAIGMVACAYGPIPSREESRTFCAKARLPPAKTSTVPTAKTAS